MKKAYIYILIDPVSQHVRYVGKTTYEKQRFQNHLSDKTRTHRGAWIRSLKTKGLRPEFTIIEECTTNDWNQQECYWIEQFRVWGFRLCNHTTGGEGAVGMVRSKEFKEKVSKSLKGISKPLQFKTPTQKLEIQDVINIKQKMCEGMTNREILSMYSNLPLNMLMLAAIRAERTWSKIKGTCGHFH